MPTNARNADDLCRRRLLSPIARRKKPISATEVASYSELSREALLGLNHPDAGLL